MTMSPRHCSLGHAGHPGHMPLNRLMSLDPGRGYPLRNCFFCLHFWEVLLLRAELPGKVSVVEVNWNVCSKPHLQ